MPWLKWPWLAWSMGALALTLDGYFKNSQLAMCCASKVMR